MSFRVLESARDDERAPLLRWMMFTGASLFGFALLWRYGLFHLMLRSDKTYLSLAILLLYVATTLHCLWRTNIIAREIDIARRVEAIVSAGVLKLIVAGPNVATSAGDRLPPGAATSHIRNLVLKAGAQGHHRIDQTLLLRGLADKLRGPNMLGSFASDTLMKLGLLGTIIGFIIMLAPIASLDASNQSAIKSSMSLMGDGMAVAMYTTLAGLIGSILVKIQYQMLDGATARLFALATDITEVYVIPALERDQNG